MKRIPLFMTYRHRVLLLWAVNILSLSVMVWMTLLFFRVIPISASYVKTVGTHTYIIGDDVWGMDSRYQELVDRLYGAACGETITIILRKNDGGWVTNEELVRNAMHASKAHVHTIVEGWASSAAISILFSGDTIKIKKQHIVGIAHLSFPRTPSSVRYDIEHNQYYKRFMTKQEWNRMLKGEDVTLFGSVVCRTAKNFVIQDTPQYCIIKGER